MNKKLVKIIFTSFIIFVVSGLFLFVIYEMNHVNKRDIKREGFDVILSDKDICTLAIEGNTLWAGGATGLFEIDMNSLVIKKIGEYKFIRTVLAVSNSLWIGHEDGLAKFDGKVIKNYTTKDGLPDNRVNALAIDKEGYLWVGTWKGALKMGYDKLEVFSSKNGLKDDMVNAILCDSKGGVWFGSYVAPRGGISYLKDNKWLYFSTENGLPHNGINALYEGKNGVWAATGFLDHGGACAFNNLDSNPFIYNTLIKSDGLAGEKVRSIYQDNAGRLWFGSEYDGVTIFDNKAINIYTVDDGLSDNEVKCMFQDNEGNMWLGTRDGITYISSEALIRLKK